MKLLRNFLRLMVHMRQMIKDMLSKRGVGLGVLIAFGLAGCGPAPIASGINDPMEAQNREIHDFNLAVDRAVLKPVSKLLGEGKPGPVSKGISHLANTLDAPSHVANNLLQLRLADAAENTLRFGVNVIFGFGGLLDPATDMGLYGKPTDFGETLHVWGVPEGAYTVVPLVGPSTDRDLAGLVVGKALNPLRFLLKSPKREAAAVIGLGAMAGNRAAYSETVDSILYDSADGYAQARLLYLQNRRHTLARGKQAEGEGLDASDTYIDPYEDPYGN